MIFITAKSQLLLTATYHLSRSRTQISLNGIR
nr:MAG TPA: hypothetical protein [Caudoviricetes sp.]